MSEFSLRDMREETSLVITRFMQQQEMSAGDNYYFFDGRLWVFFTGIPYGFCGMVKILKPSDDPELYQSALNKDWSRHVVDKDSFSGKCLRRIKSMIEGKDINILELVVPECYPPVYITLEGWAS